MGVGVCMGGGRRIKWSGTPMPYALCLPPSLSIYVCHQLQQKSPQTSQSQRAIFFSMHCMGTLFFWSQKLRPTQTFFSFSLTALFNLYYYNTIITFFNLKCWCKRKTETDITHHVMAWHSSRAADDGWFISFDCHFRF